MGLFLASALLGLGLVCELFSIIKLYNSCSVEGTRTIISNTFVAFRSITEIYLNHTWVRT